MPLPAFLRTSADRPFLPVNLGGNPFGWTADREGTFAVQLDEASAGF